MKTNSLAAKLAFTPTILVTLFVFVGCIIYTVAISLTDSGAFISLNFVGLDQYEALFRSSRWAKSMTNMVLFGVGMMAGTLVMGYLLAVLIDQKIRSEVLFRTIFLYPFALSYIVTGFAWQWFLNPELGFPKLMGDLGFESLQFGLLADRDLAIYAIVIAAVWHSSGLVMAIMLASLRGVDEQIWMASKVEGIPARRVYLSIILPMMGPAFATCVPLLAFSIIRNYDLVVAMTNGGPGISTEVPAKFVMDYLFERQNAGLASAAAAVMLMTVVIVAVPIYFGRHLLTRRKARRATT